MKIKTLILVILFSSIWVTTFSQYGAPNPSSVGTGISNTVVGSSAGNDQMAGNNNTIFGKNSAFQLTMGSDNASFGSESGLGLIEGNGNSFFGAGTGRTNDGSANVFIGRSAGDDNETGSHNTFLGESAGLFVKGDRNICIGSYSGLTSPALISDRLFIDVDHVDDPLIYGEFDNDFVKINGTFEVTAGLSNPSDVNLKTNFRDIDQTLILDNVSKLKIQEWNYKQHPNHRHIGPTAQDFFNLFNIGSDNKHISTIDASGVALASIKALKKENDTLSSKLYEQEMLIKNLLLRIEALEEKR